MAALAMTLVVTGGLVAACGGDDTPAASNNAAEAGADDADSTNDVGSNSDGTNNDGASSDTANNDGAGDDGRAFDSTDDAVITAVVQGTQAERAEWDGSTLRVIFDSGSAESPTEWIKCSAAEVLLADDEKAVLVYPDGELDCAERPGY